MQNSSEGWRAARSVRRQIKKHQLAKAACGELSLPEARLRSASGGASGAKGARSPAGSRREGKPQIWSHLPRLGTSVGQRLAEGALSSSSPREMPVEVTPEHPAACWGRPGLILGPGVNQKYLPKTWGSLSWCCDASMWESSAGRANQGLFKPIKLRRDGQLTPSHLCSAF